MGLPSIGLLEDLVEFNNFNRSTRQETTCEVEVFLCKLSPIRLVEMVLIRLLHVRELSATLRTVVLLFESLPHAQIAEDMKAWGQESSLNKAVFGTLTDWHATEDAVDLL